MRLAINFFVKPGILKHDIDYLIRALMLVIFLFFGYQKGSEYKAQVLTPYVSHGSLISWITRAPQTAVPKLPHNRKYRGNRKLGTRPPSRGLRETQLIRA
jgi:uncharacterized membrane protein YkgB